MMVEFASGSINSEKIENRKEEKKVINKEFVKEYKIKPLLEEYFYGDEENYKEALKILGHEDELNKQ